MDGKQYFQKCCDQIGLSIEDTFVVGVTKKLQVDRYEHHFDHQKRKESQQFVVLYVKEGDFYIAWDLNAKKAKTRDDFSVSAESLRFLEHGQTFTTLKSVEYSGWGQETVYVFDRSGVLEFLNNVNQKDS